LEHVAHVEVLHGLGHKEEFEDQVSSLLHYYLHPLNDPKDASKLTQMLAICMKEQGVEATISSPLPKRDVCQVNNQKCTGRELKMTTKLGGYHMN